MNSDDINARIKFQEFVGSAIRNEMTMWVTSGVKYNPDLDLGTGVPTATYAKEVNAVIARIETNVQQVDPQWRMDPARKLDIFCANIPAECNMVVRRDVPTNGTPDNVIAAAVSVLSSQFDKQASMGRIDAMEQLMHLKQGADEPIRAFTRRITNIASHASLADDSPQQRDANIKAVLMKGLADPKDLEAAQAQPVTTTSKELVDLMASREVRRNKDKRKATDAAMPAPKLQAVSHAAKTNRPVASPVRSPCGWCGYSNHREDECRHKLTLRCPKCRAQPADHHPNSCPTAAHVFAVQAANATYSGGDGGCYVCGDTDHRARTCPNRHGGGGGQPGAQRERSDQRRNDRRDDRRDRRGDRRDNRRDTQPAGRRDDQLF